MQEKKPVYNGYEERYLSGAELKDLFKDHYYATGRHHSVILGLSIPDFLELKGISDSKEYRIFINKFFCRVMNADTDGLIVFFGHNALDSIKPMVDLTTIQLAKICPVCGAPMKFKEGKYGEFLGCSRYPSCKQTAKIPIIGNCLHFIFEPMPMVASAHFYSVTIVTVSVPGGRVSSLSSLRILVRCSVRSLPVLSRL